MKMSKIGNQTNSQDPYAVSSRIFVGNLNTFQCSKTDIERMFQRYGKLVGISMHKGYAFVQFVSPADARNACLGEDGRNIMNQILDVNMVAEPKPHQTGRKRQNLNKTGNDWEYYYDSYYASAALNRNQNMPNKKLKMSLNGAQVLNGHGQNVTIPQTNIKLYCNSDILICGNCREIFPTLIEMIEHRKNYCKLRFLCKCDQTTDTSSNNNDDPVNMSCTNCKEACGSPLELLVHSQSVHAPNIVEIGCASLDARTTQVTKGFRGVDTGLVMVPHLETNGVEKTATNCLNMNNNNNNNDVSEKAHQNGTSLVAKHITSIPV